VLLEVQRPVIANGIDDIATRPDLADRCLHLLLPPLVSRSTESRLTDGFTNDAPAIFAALLDGLVLAVRDHAAVRLDKLPRMADFATWAAAGLPALGFTADEFLTAYTRNREHLSDLALEASPVAAALVAFMASRESWTGSSVDLLGRLADANPGAAASQAWPRSTKGLWNALRRLAPALRGAGLTVDQDKTRLSRSVTVCKVGFEASQASHVSRGLQEQGLSPGQQSVTTCHPKRHEASHVSPEASHVSPENGVGDACDACDTLKPTLHGTARQCTAADYATAKGWDTP